MATAAHLDEAALWQHALGLSAEPERALAEVHLAGCAACRAQLARAVETVALLPMALTSVAPPVELRARLLGSMAAGRFARHVDALAALFDIDRASSARQLGRLDDESAWKPGPLPGEDCVAAVVQRGGLQFGVELP